MSRYIRPALGIGLTIAILAVLARTADLDALAAVFGQVDRVRVAAAALVMAGVVVLVAFRWRLTLSANGVSLPLPEGVSMILSASALNSISPSKAGDLIKVYALRDRASVSVTLGSMVAERVIDIAALGLIATPAALLSGRPALALFGLALIAGPICLIPVMRLLDRWPLPAKLTSKLEAFAEAIRKLAARPRLLCVLLAIGLVIWGAMILIAWLLYQAAGAVPTLAQMAAALPIGILAGLSPLTLGGIGTRDAALMLLLADQATQAQSLAATLMYTAVAYWGPALFGTPFVLRTLARKRRTERTEHG